MICNFMILDVSLTFLFSFDGPQSIFFTNYHLVNTFQNKNAIPNDFSIGANVLIILCIKQWDIN